MRHYFSDSLTFTLIALLSAHTLSLSAAEQGGEMKQYSTAGFYAQEDIGREVLSMNPAWRLKLDPKNELGEMPTQSDYDDSSWATVNLPDGLEVLPAEASGCVNYQGVAWYRKHFTPTVEQLKKRQVLYFEAIMGKSKIWVNGQLVKEHFGGYLPIGVEIHPYLKPDVDNVITVWCDNSDDANYAPGKPQKALDFCYFGGIYRDCWLISTDKDTYITDENMVDQVAGGGCFISFPFVSEEESHIEIKTDIHGKGHIRYELFDAAGKSVAKGEGAQDTLEVKKARLWSPRDPYLYELQVRVSNDQGEIVDGYMKKLGIRRIDFSHEKGLVLNGKPYHDKLIGANRHQDFAVIGNALSNNLHWRDAMKLKASGLELVRNAHYPQDPAFMDACDELGLFVIINTPGWQFWNNAPHFAQRVYGDITQMVRRDRNRPSAFLWEPILNETHYPADFAKKVSDIVKSELPGSWTASDLIARGSEHFDVIFTHPDNGGKDGIRKEQIRDNKVYFTREFGDNVDSWFSHNSPSRVARQWGEIPQLIQAFHYTKPSYPVTSIDVLKKAAPYHFGGSLWHSFDHQRGYHPDPFYGGIMDAYRLPKTSFYMFQGQADHLKPMVYIAHQMTPFSPKDVTVISNAPRVRLTSFVDAKPRVMEKRGDRWFTFEKAFDFQVAKAQTREGSKTHQVSILAEALNDKGEVVATHKVSMPQRPARLQLIVEDEGIATLANGGDQVVVVAQIVDSFGVVRRLNNGQVQFSIEGSGLLYGAQKDGTLNVPLLWGDAPVIVQAGLEEGEIKVTASMRLDGVHVPLSGEVKIPVLTSTQKLLYDRKAKNLSDGAEANRVNRTSISEEEREKAQESLKKVGEDQETFSKSAPTS